MKTSFRFSMSGVAALLACAGFAAAQPYVVNTYAGIVMPPAPVRATDVSIGSLVGTDGAGNLYINLGCAYRIDSAGFLTLVAGTCTDKDPEAAPVDHLVSAIEPAAVDRAGSVYFYSFGDLRSTIQIKKVDTNQSVTLIATIPEELENFVLPDGRGGVYLADAIGNTIRRLENGVLTTIAGNGTATDSGDGGPASKAGIPTPQYMALDNAGNLYVTEGQLPPTPDAPSGTPHSRIRRITPDGIITTFAGTGKYGDSGDGGLAIAADIRAYKITTDGAGNVYFSETMGGRIRKVNTAGIISTVAVSDKGDLAVDQAGNVYGESYANTIIRTAPDGTTSVAGGRVRCCSGDGGSARDAQITDVQSMAADGMDNVYFAGPKVIRKIDQTGKISTLAGQDATYDVPLSTYTPSDVMPANLAPIGNVAGFAASKQGDVYFVSKQGQTGVPDYVRRLSPDGTVSRFAGGFAAPNYKENGDPAINVPLQSATAVAVDGQGIVYIADQGRIRKVTTDGRMYTIAGNGTPGQPVDGPALRTQVDVTQLGADAAGNVYFTNRSEPKIRKLSIAGVISTVAGSEPSDALSVPPFAVNSAGEIFFGDTGDLVRKIDSNGVVTTIAANNNGPYYPGDGYLASSVPFLVAGLAAGANGEVYVSSSAPVIRVLVPTAGSPPVFSPPKLAGVAGAANYAPNVVAPGEIVVLFGTGLGPDTLVQAQASPSGTLPTELAGTTVLWDRVIPAPLLYTSAQQVAFVVPYEAAGDIGGSSSVDVLYNGALAESLFSLQVVDASPGLFTVDASGSGQALAVNLDGTVNGPGNPTKQGTPLILYATGLGQTSPEGIDGAIAAIPPPLPPQPVLPVTATVGGMAAQMLYAGGAPGFVAGLTQINILVPPTAPTGPAVPVTISVGSASGRTSVTSQPKVTIAITR